MAKFIIKHWLGFTLVAAAGVLLALDPVRNLMVSGLAAGSAILSFIERFFAGGKGPVSGPKPDPVRQIDDDLDLLLRQGKEAERIDQEAISIVASRKRQNPN